MFRSTGDRDELSAAAAWLYKATNDHQYLEEAEANYPRGTSWSFYWNDANAGAAVSGWETNYSSVFSIPLLVFITFLFF